MDGIYLPLTPPVLLKLCRTKLSEIPLSRDTMGTEKEMKILSDVEPAGPDVKAGEITKRGLKICLNACPWWGPLEPRYVSVPTRLWPKVVLLYF